jgi:hypothetical protein
MDEAYWNALVDRVGTTATVWLGTTLACAQCHSHKYDPFSQRDFYGLLAFFDNSEFSVKGSGYNRQVIEPELDLGEPDERSHRQAMERELAQLKGKPNKSPEELKRQTELSDGLEEYLKRYPSTLVLKERTSEETPSTYVRVRGSFLSKGEKIEAAVPAVLPPLPASVKADRLALARWIVDPENPLTARVNVNRHWSQFFGRGLVETEEDFGTRGAACTHPELLDWLATEYIRLGWSTKKLHKLIVMSSTYRQDSRITPVLLERDPDNRLLARGPRFRLQAEQVRDATLAIAGLLSPKIGGPSVFPPQPETTSIGDHGNVKWHESEGADRYRRGLYTFWRRSALYPALANFDAPSRESCTVRRPQSNTPLQALTLLNDVTAREAATAFAKRIRNETGSTDIGECITFAFRLCTARQPSPGELSTLLRLYDRALRVATEDDSSTEALVAAAEVKTDKQEFAAWFLVAQALLNLDETLTKE